MGKRKETITEQLQQLQMLMHRTSSKSHMNAGRAHDPHRGKGRILAILKIKPEISQKDLTFLLGISKQAIAELLTKLEKQGLVTREPSEEDKRVMMVKLTKEGLEAASDIDDSEPEMAKILDCLSEAELETFSEYLGRIIKRCEEQFPDEDFQQRHRAMEEFMRRGTEHGCCGHPDPARQPRPRHRNRRERP